MREGRAVRFLGALLVTVIALGVAGSAALAAPSSADNEDRGTPTDPDLVSVAADLRRTMEHLDLVERRLDDARQEVLSTSASLNVTDGLIALNNVQVDAVERRVRVRGVVAYRQSGVSTAAPLDIGRTADIAIARQYTRASTDVDLEDLGKLRAVATLLADERVVKVADRDEVLASRDQLLEERVELESTRADLQARLDRLGGLPVMGESALTGAQLAGWFRSTGATPQLALGTTIDDVAAMFVEEGAAEGVRGDVAFAQAIIETGSFGVAAGNNFSGIGVCDSCTGGYAFVDPREGVRAQIQLLRNYADASSRASNLAHPPSPSLYGSDVAKAARLYDTFFLKGKAPLWNQMGNGNWATDPVYAPKVLSLYARMVAWANATAVGSSAA
jgi:hypothetical protein